MIKLVPLPALLITLEEYENILDPPIKNFKYNETREYFNNPRHIKVFKNELVLKEPQLDKLKKLLVNKYNFNENYINNITKFLNNFNNDIFIDD